MNKWKKQVVASLQRIRRSFISGIAHNNTNIQPSVPERAYDKRRRGGSSVLEEAGARCRLGTGRWTHVGAPRAGGAGEGEDADEVRGGLEPHYASNLDFDPGGRRSRSPARGRSYRGRCGRTRCPDAKTTDRERRRPAVPPEERTIRSPRWDDAGAGYRMERSPGRGGRWRTVEGTPRRTECMRGVDPLDGRGGRAGCFGRRLGQKVSGLRTGILARLPVESPSASFGLHFFAWNTRRFHCG
jgi:hypothetical protein